MPPCWGQPPTDLRSRQEAPAAPHGPPAPVHSRAPPAPCFRRELVPHARKDKYAKLQWIQCRPESQLQNAASNGERSLRAAARPPKPPNEPKRNRKPYFVRPPVAWQRRASEPKRKVSADSAAQSLESPLPGAYQGAKSLSHRRETGTSDRCRE